MKVIRAAILAGFAVVVFAALVLAATLVDLNTASLKDLQSLKGVGTVKANKIIAARPYKSIDELSRAGFSAKQIAALRPFVTVGSLSVSTVVPKTSASRNARSTAVTGPLDLNTATQKELEALKGIGPATARKILAARPYHSVDDLAKAGLSSKQLAAVKPFVTVSVPLTAAIPAQTRPTLPKPASATGAIDLNTASLKDLESLKGVGPATAQKIIAARPFATIDDLARAGVSARVIAEIRPLVTVSGAPASVSQVVPVLPPSPVANPAAPPAPGPVTQSAVVARTTAKLAPGEVVNINTASKELLDELPGIGPVKAQAIIDGRPYATIEDIMKVKGIKQGEFGKIRNLITVK